jgi:oxygen-dependent protoporphyrinogen oxidase
MRIVVIGAGLTGLSAAHTLKRELRARALDAGIVLLESHRQAGGHARTVLEGGFLAEAGPSAFLDREPEMMALVDELGLTPRLVEARPPARRFLLRGSRLHRVPESPRGLLTSSLLSWPAKLRLIAEPFARRAPAGIEETVHGFATRRIGREAADVLVEAAVGGISAGDARQLSVSAQFPMIVEMERDHGSLIRAALARRGRRSRRLTLSRGIGTLADAMASALDGACRLGATALALVPDASGWRVETPGGAIAADLVLLATPARTTSSLLRPLAADAADALDRVPYATVAVAALGFEARQLRTPLDGYGYLVTRGEPGAVLGVSWDSTLFPGRAPEGHVLVRAFLGGLRHPEVATWTDGETMAHALEHVSTVLGADGTPVLSRLFRWPSAIAQYTLGHLDRVRRVREAVQRLPGVWVCGTAFDGVSMNHAVASGRRVGRAIADAVAAVRPTPQSAAS